MAKAPGLMTWLSPSVVRALLLSAIALVGSVALYNQYQATQELDHAQTLRDQKERYFSGLCFDSLTIDQVQIKDAKHDIQLRLKDRWRTADGGVIEDIEASYPGCWKMCLSTTEFLVGDYDKLNNIPVNNHIFVPAFQMVDSIFNFPI